MRLGVVSVLSSLMLISVGVTLITQFLRNMDGTEDLTWLSVFEARDSFIAPLLNA